MEAKMHEQIYNKYFHNKVNQQTGWSGTTYGLETGRAARAYNLNTKGSERSLCQINKQCRRPVTISNK